MKISIAVSKIKKYATSSSGDTAEVVERPQGGVSVVLADGQRSGRGAKWISTLVVRKVIALLAEGVRDGAAARAASDTLYTERRGKVSATLNILSVDLQTKTIVITRNNPAPVLLAHNDEIISFDKKSIPIGNYRDTRPVINQLKAEPGITLVAYTDGITHSGSRNSNKMDVPAYTRDILSKPKLTAQDISDNLLDKAIELDKGRPVDDTSVVVLRITNSDDDLIRRMYIQVPITL